MHATVITVHTQTTFKKASPYTSTSVLIQKCFSILKSFKLCDQLLLYSHCISEFVYRVAVTAPLDNVTTISEGAGPWVQHPTTRENSRQLSREQAPGQTPNTPATCSCAHALPIADMLCIGISAGQICCCRVTRSSTTFPSAGRRPVRRAARQTARTWYAVSSTQAMLYEHSTE